jgi:FtsH-binding integral membrane protein
MALRSSIPRAQDYAYSSRALTRDETRGVFGQVMGLVAATIGFLALGAYLGRDLSGSGFFVFFLGAFACVFGLQFATARGHEQLAIGLLFGVGVLLGLAVAPVLSIYAKADPSALSEAAGTTTLFVGALGSYGYATRRDLSSWARTLFWALLALIVFGLIATLVAIPGSNVIYAVLGLVIFGGFTIFDFNRLRRATMASSVPIAASIFLDIFNVFLLLLSLFGGGGSRR